jgi:hypothetical protein
MKITQNNDILLLRCNTCSAEDNASRKTTKPLIFSNFGAQLSLPPEKQFPLGLVYTTERL